MKQSFRKLNTTCGGVSFVRSAITPKLNNWFLLSEKSILTAQKKTQILLADALPPKFELIGTSIFIGRYKTRTADEKKTNRSV